MGWETCTYDYYCYCGMADGYTVSAVIQYLFSKSSMKLASASCTAPRLLNIPTNLNTAGASLGEFAEGVGEGSATGSGSGGCARAAGGGAGRCSCLAGGGKGGGVGGRLREGGRATTGVNWTAVVRWMLLPSSRMENVQTEVRPTFSVRAAHDDKH